MTLVIASILGFLTGGVATFFLLKLQTRKHPAASHQTTEAPVDPAPEVVSPVAATTEAGKAIADAVKDSTPAPILSPEPEGVSETPIADDVSLPIRYYLNPETELLTYRIGTWGNSGNVVYVPQLVRYTQHPSHQVRQAVAIALGKIAAAGSLRREEPQAILALGKLSRDPVSSVRELAITALGNVKSTQVIPLLQQALRDPDQDVVRLASTALQKFKYYPVRPATKPIAPLKKR